MSETTQDYANFLKKEATQKINQLEADAKANFGIMSPQHMVEHLIKTIKFSIKTYGEAPAEPAEKHLQFKKFIFSNAPFAEGDPAKAKLETLKYENLAEAKAGFEEAIARFFTFFEGNPEAKPYNDFFGALSQEELTVFHHKHIVHHLKQFSLV